MPCCERKVERECCGFGNKYERTCCGGKKEIKEDCTFFGCLCLCASCPVFFSIFIKGVTDRLMFRSQKFRFYNFLLLLIMFPVAIGLGRGIPNWFATNPDFPKINLEEDCDPSSTKWCVYRQLLYRVSFALCILFFLWIPVTFFLDIQSIFMFYLKLFTVGMINYFFGSILNFFLNPLVIYLFSL